MRCCVRQYDMPKLDVVVAGFEDTGLEEYCELRCLCTGPSSSRAVGWLRSGMIVPGPILIVSLLLSIDGWALMVLFKVLLSCRIGMKSPKITVVAASVTLGGD